MSVDKICKNCKHYAQIFFWGNNHFCSGDDGYCTLCIHRYKFRLTKANKAACEYWGHNAEALQIRNQKIENTLLYISKQLKDITLLLKAEKQ